MGRHEVGGVGAEPAGEVGGECSGLVGSVAVVLPRFGEQVGPVPKRLAVAPPPGAVVIELVRHAGHLAQGKIADPVDRLAAVVGVDRPNQGRDRARVVVLGDVFGKVAKLACFSFGEQLPEPAGSYKGRAFDWELYSLEAHIEDSGFDVLRVELALAEEGPMSYIVALVTLPEAYAAHPQLYDTIFTHAVYGLMPWE